MRYLAAALLLAVSGIAHANTFTVVAGYSEVEFDDVTASPIRWTLCQRLCREGGERRAVLIDANDGVIRLTSAQSDLTWASDVRDTDDHVLVTFSSGEAEISYRLSKQSPEIFLSLPPDFELEVATGESFVPEPLPGFGAIYTRVQAAQISSGGQSIYAFDDERPAEVLAAGDNWTGVRSRYWAFLLQPHSGEHSVVLGYDGENRPQLRLRPTAATSAAAIRLYAGPIEWQLLRGVSPDLSELLFAALWDFLRALTFGMMILFGWINSVVRNHGLAIILLSLSVKVLMTPLTLLADRWQRDVNRIQTLLKPELDEIRRNFKGEEAHEKTLAVYKKHNVSTLYTFKSAAGFLIQIPVFIAAFDMLAENIAFNEVAFIWMSDLAKPDRFAELPFLLPFFGGWLNLLPFLMTGLSTLAAWLQAEDSLSPELQRQQSLRLYGMAIAFFVLFYTFPAGMVLYWTSSNLFHLIKVESGRLIKK